MSDGVRQRSFRVRINGFPSFSRLIILQMLLDMNLNFMLTFVSDEFIHFSQVKFICCGMNFLFSSIILNYELIVNDN